MTSSWSSRLHQTTPVHEGINEQPPAHNQIRFWTLQPGDILLRYEDPHRSGLQTLNNPVATENPQTVPHFFTSTPATHLNAKQALFSRKLLQSQTTRCYKKNSTPLQYYVSKALLHSCDTLPYKSPRVSNSRTVLPLVTPTHRKEDNCPCQYKTIGTLLALHNCKASGPTLLITVYHKNRIP